MVRRLNTALRAPTGESSAARRILLALLAPLITSCSHLANVSPHEQKTIETTLQTVQTKYAPADHLGLYRVGVECRSGRLALTGVVDRAEARLESVQAIRAAGLKVADEIKVLPEKELGDRTWGIACLSVSSGRELPEHKSELGTQALMGELVRVLQRSSNGLWAFVETPDRYPSWLEKGTFVRCTFDEAQAWTNSALLIVTAFEALILEEPRADAPPVSDVVTADLIKKVGERGSWYQVELPDRRTGFLPKSAAEDYRVWQTKRQPTAANIERTARTLLGRPYLWGGNSPKGFDCSGFTKTVFFLNGIDLGRNASHQARQGVPVPLDADLSQLKTGDLLFFGRPDRGARPERIHHVAIYLGGKLFIHSSERVQINSLDPASPIRDELRIRTLLFARRIL